MKSGKYKPWIDLMKWPAAASAILMFANTAALPVWVRITVVSVSHFVLYGSVGFMGTASLMLITQMAGSDMRERSRLSILRMQFGMLLPAAFSIVSIQFSMTGAYDLFLGSNFMMTRAVFGAVLILSGAMLLSGTAKKYDPPQTADRTEPIPVKVMIGSVFTNRNLLRVFAAQFLFTIAQTVTATMTIYYFMYVINDHSKFGLEISVSNYIRFAAALVAPILGVRLGKKRSAVIGMLCYGLLSAAILLFAKASIYVYIVLAGLSQFGIYLFMGFAPLYILDSGEYAFWKTGRDNRAAVMGLSGVPGALASFALPFLVPFALGLLGYTNGMSSSAAVNLNLMWAIGGVPALFALLAAAVMRFGYGISDGDAERFAKENERLGVDGNDGI